ncbi:MAG: excinuclease ABC subunit UvrC [Lachnospiraceae bacterium]|nr:excinuclease ABC subunit UvrC [Lachnospiraceae bacterium]
MFDIEEELKKLPACPGVYIMHDKKDKILYVGKAVNLKNRVRQYFQASHQVSSKIARMIEQIHHFEYIITDSELEALVLECNLIKEYRPPYNTMLTDDKGYPFIKATVYEDFPRLLFAREMKRDRARYYGPYTSATAVKETLVLMQKLFQLRSCNRNLPRDIGKGRPCLNYHIGQCLGPCQGYISKEEYAENFQQALDFLNGNHKPMIDLLEKKMREASEKWDFEEAAKYRDLLTSVQQVAQKQKITSTTGEEERDIIALAKGEDEAVVQVFFMRGGKMIGREHFHLNHVRDESRESVLEAFVKQFYSGTPYIPKQILLQTEIQDATVVEEWLSDKKKQKVTIVVPKRGEKEKMIELAHKNALMVLKQDSEKIRLEEKRTKGALKEIQEWLGMKELSRVESYDISNISGFASVGSMVVFEEGRPKKNDYRKFRIKSVEGPNDYASMYEVLTRRFLHGLKEREENAKIQSFGVFPDLIMMDGGKGQVNVALKVLDELGLCIPVCGMVKDDNHRTRGLYFNNEEIPISTRSEGFRLITRIQDETHRFAIEYHRSLRGKAQVHSILDDIPGIGETRRRNLLKHFKSFEKIKAASVEELENVPSMNHNAAASVYDFLHKPPKEENKPPKEENKNSK